MEYDSAVDSLTAAYFVAFVGGAAFSVLSFLLSGIGEHGDHAHDGHDHAGHDHGGHGHDHALGDGHGHELSHAHDHALVPSGVGKVLSPLVNLNALCALALVGGGVGFIARRFLDVAAGTSLALALPAGLAGAYLVGGLLAFLRRHSTEERPFEYEGTVAQVSAAIRDGGVGEIVYVKDGARTSLPARSVAGAIAPGTEVIIVALERGVARVEPSAKLLALKEGP